MRPACHCAVMQRLYKHSPSPCTRRSRARDGESKQAIRGASKLWNFERLTNGHTDRRGYCYFVISTWYSTVRAGYPQRKDTAYEYNNTPWSLCLAATQGIFSLFVHGRGKGSNMQKFPLSGEWFSAYMRKRAMILSLIIVILVLYHINSCYSITIGPVILIVAAATKRPG